MIDLNQLKILAQLVDSLDTSSGQLEKSYNDNNGEEFMKYKKQILDTQKKISEILQ